MNNHEDVTTISHNSPRMIPYSSR